MAPTDTGSIEAGHTLLEVVDAMQSLEDASVREIAAHVGTSKSTVHRHLKTLHEHEYVVRNPDGSYSLGLRFLDVGGLVRERHPEWRLIREKVSEIATDIGELAQFVVEEHGYGVFVFRERGRHAVNTEARVGTRTYLNQTSAGKALFAHLPAARQEEILARRGLPEKTDRTITDRETFLAECETIVDRGYAIDRGEHIPGLWSVGTPISGPDGTVIGALSVAGPEHRMRDEYLAEEVAPLLLGLCNEIELNITYA